MAVKRKTQKKSREAKLAKKQREEEQEEKHSWHTDLAPETKKGIFAVAAFMVAALFILSYLGKGGSVGAQLFRFFDFLLGRGYFFAPIALVLVGFSFLRAQQQKVVGAVLIGGVAFFLSSLTTLNIVFGEHTGGMLGSLISAPLLSLFDFWAGLVIAGGLLVISFLLMLNIPIWRRRPVVESEESEEEDISEGEQTVLEEAEPAPERKSLLEAMGSLRSTLAGTKASASVGAEPVIDQPPAEPPPPLPGPEMETKEKDEDLISLGRVTKSSPYRKPPLELLNDDRGQPSSGDIRANVNTIKRTFENFGIVVDMDEVSVGPTVTQYTLKPAEGVKLAKITSLNNDLSLALAAHPIRIEAPIPGKSLVGIEIPNRSVSLVGLRSLIDHKIFREKPAPLMFALGRDVTGNPVFADLAKMPHLLISGSTGSGKSVCMHTLTSSLLYRNPPEILRFIIVDPKRVELSMYNDIPHLLTPVITDAKKTVQALRWATKEMDRRYDMLSQAQKRDIVGYNAGVSKKAAGDERELMPYIVVMIDELADLMAVYSREVESSIVRLAQMARAVGIHLIVATQRPSVEVITGLIKANITSRVAFQVASQIDSRTVLDMAGAEKLLGDGDMLFLSGDAGKPRRIQGAFVTEQEVKRVVDFLREQREEPEYDESIFDMAVDDDKKGSGESGSDEDPFYNDAKHLILEAGKGSASFLQRRLRVGYARAARLLDLLEADGVIGPADGAKPREVLVPASEFFDSEEAESPEDDIKTTEL